MSVVYRERERDRYNDSRSTISSARRGGGDDAGYTTVRRYRIGEDDDSRSGRFAVNRPGERVEETRIVRRERDVEEEPVRRREPEGNSSRTSVVVRRDREDDSRRDYGYDRGYRRDDRDREDTRELVIRRTTTRDEPREEGRIERYDERRDYRERDYDMISPDRERDRYGDLQHYSRSTEYFSQPQQPQTIIIKNEPIIIRERARDEDYQMVRRSEADEERSVVRREPERPSPREEEYFYEKKTKEVERDDDFYERRDRRLEREVSPHDSVSQVGRKSSRGRNRDYSSDDSMVYVRKEVKEEDYDRDESPHHRRHIAEGVIAGVGAAELLRHHKNKEGRETSGTLGRLGKDVGAGVVGAVGAELVTRARSRYRSKSRRRDQSESESRDTRKSRGGGGSRRNKKGGSRDSSEGSDKNSKFKTLGGLGLAAAGIAAVAAIAQRKQNQKAEEEEGRGRSHSRPRTDSVGGAPGELPDDARNPKHRNKRIAEAGAAGAVVAGLIEGARARSQAKKGERSRSRLRQGLEVAAAGLGSAAIAGIYERNKGKKEAEAAMKVNERSERRAARERSRSASRPPVGPYYDGNRNATMSEPGLIDYEYGEGPMQGNNYGAGYYGRPQAQDNFYSQDTSMVPAAGVAGAGAAAYGAREARDRSRSGSRNRARSLSVSSGEGRRRRRHRRRSRSQSVGELGAGAAGAGIGAAAESEHDRKQRRREEKARRRYAENHGHDPYEDGYDPAPYPATPPAAGDPYGYQQPAASGFPPPPGTAPAAYPAQPQYATAGQPYAAPPAEAAYNPANFPPPPPGAVPAAGAAGNYNDAFASGANMDPYDPRTRRADENVSAAANPPPYGLSRGVPPPGIAVHAPTPPPPDPASNINLAQQSAYIPPTDPSYNPSPPDPTPRSRAASQGPSKGVKFADEVPRAPSSDPTTTTRGYEPGDDTESTADEDRHRHRTSDVLPSSTNGTSSTRIGSDGRVKVRKHHSRRRSADPSSFDQPSSSRSAQPVPARDETTSPLSDDTEVLPDRFDQQGRRMPEPGEDPLADRFESILSGTGLGRRLFGNFAEGLTGRDARRSSGAEGGDVGEGRRRR